MGGMCAEVFPKRCALRCPGDRASRRREGQVTPHAVRGHNALRPRELRGSHGRTRGVSALLGPSLCPCGHPGGPPPCRRLRGRLCTPTDCAHTRTFRSLIAVPCHRSRKARSTHCRDCCTRMLRRRSYGYGDIRGKDPAAVGRCPPATRPQRLVFCVFRLHHTSLIAVVDSSALPSPGHKNAKDVALRRQWRGRSLTARRLGGDLDTLHFLCPSPNPEGPHLGAPNKG